MLLYHWPSFAFLAAALLADALLPERRGPFDRIPHPVRWIGAAIAALDARLNRKDRSDSARRTRGCLTVFLVVGGAAFAGWLAHRIFVFLPFGWLIELVTIVSLLAAKSLAAHVGRVAAPLAAGDLAGARTAVGAIVGRDTAALDRHGVARGAIESLAENFSDGVVAPALWYALFGLPGMAAFKAANTLDSMIGHRTQRHRAFGWAAARLDDLMNVVPARVSAVLLATAAFAVPGARASAAYATAWRDARKHRSPNAGWPEAAMAGALGLALGGPRRYGGGDVAEGWLGSGRADAEAEDIRRALRLYWVAFGALALGAALLFRLR